MSNQRSPRKRKGALREQERNLRKLDERNVCDCTHTKPKTGDLSITPARSQGKLRYICNECDKDLNLNPINEDALRQACDIIDNAIDAIKITLDMSKEPEQKIHKHVSETQFRVRNEICEMYKSAQKANNRNRGQGNGGRRDNSSSSWAKAEIRH